MDQSTEKVEQFHASTSFDVNDRLTQSNKHVNTITNKPNKPMLSCRECNEQYSSASVLLKHEKVHIAERPIVCLKCNKRFTCVQRLRRHEHTQTGKRSFVCDICDKIFNRAAYLRQHGLTHTGERKFFCEICNKKFSQA